MAWGVAPFCHFRYFCGTIIHYLRDIKTISARPLRPLRLCVRIVMPHGWAKPISVFSVIWLPLKRRPLVLCEIIIILSV